MKTIETDDVVVEASERPKVAELIQEYQACSPMDGAWDQLSTNDDIRFARWPGQTPDGKKHDAAYLQATNRKAFPWDGASDTRIFMADEVINEIGAGLYVAFRRAMGAQKMSLGGEGARYGLALVEHWMNPLVMEDLIDQLRLSAQYWGAYGKFFLHPRWAREVQLERRVITLEEIVTLLDAAVGAGVDLAGMGGGEEAVPQSRDGTRGARPSVMVSGAEFAQLVQQAGEDKEIMRICMGMVKVAQGLYHREEFKDEKLDLPELSEATLRQAVKDLASEGEASIPVPYVCRDELEILCLKPYAEVLVRGDVTDLKRARVFRRVFLDEVSLRRKIVEEGWDKDWVAAALKHKGKVSRWGSTDGLSGGAVNDPGKFADRAYTMYQVPGTESGGDVEVVYGYYWALDRDNVPGVFCTVFHPEVCSPQGPHAAGSGGGEGVGKGGYAAHGLAEEGMIPFLLGRREVLSGHLMESRGVPQIVNGWQREKKVQRDARGDLASIGVLPPINKYANANDANYRFGPGVVNKVTRGFAPEFMQVPKQGEPLAKGLEVDADADKRRYFGLMAEDIPAGLSQVHAQVQADAFLMAWTLAFGMGLRLAQVNMSDAEFARITGAPAGWLDQRRQQRKLFGAVLEFDVRELDPEFVLKQAEAINKVVVPADTTGVVNRSVLTRAIFHAISPRLAREAIVPEAEASQQLFDRVNADVAMMFLGNVPRLVENDPTAGQKLQYLEQILQGNPVYQNAMAQGAAMAQQQGGASGTPGARPSDGEMGQPVNPAVRFVELLGVYRQNLEQSVKQERNKQIGRVGVDTSALEGQR